MCLSHRLKPVPPLIAGGTGFSLWVAFCLAWRCSRPARPRPPDSTTLAPGTHHLTVTLHIPAAPGETNRRRLLTFVVIERKGKVRFVTAYPMHPSQREIYEGEE